MSGGGTSTMGAADWVTERRRVFEAKQFAVVGAVSRDGHPDEEWMGSHRWVCTIAGAPEQTENQWVESVGGATHIG